MAEFERDCEEIPVEEKIILAGDLNGHIGERADGYKKVHGVTGTGYETKKENVFWNSHCNRNWLSATRILRRRWRNL